MQRIFLHYKGEYVHLADGDTIVGRDLGCRLRFNDPAVSRQHFRIVVSDGDATLEDMGSTNGTKVNRVPVTGRVGLCDRDKIQVGGRELTVYFLNEDEIGEGPESNTLVDATPPKPPQPSVGLSGVPAAAPVQTCSQCGSAIESGSPSCSSCGHAWRDYRAGATTMVHRAATGAERRRHPRAAVDIPVVYSSDTLEVQSVAKNLSLSGVFISTEFLDPVGTDCSVVVMAEGGSAFELAGRVARVIQSGQPEGTAPGLGIEFESMNAEARQWLWRTLKSQISELGVMGEPK